MADDPTARGQYVAHDLHTGDVLEGKYRIERVLGQGGMGIVVRATHLALGEPVAIKMLTAEAMQNAEYVERFAREAQAAAKIRSEFVARTHDVGVLATGAPYMVMEYLDGEDLAKRLAARGRLPIHDSVRYFLQACVAVAEAHGCGIVHRDLKPSNLFVIRRSDGVESVKVVDFGISKTKGAHLAMTGTHVMMGTPLYASPEQMRSAADVDSRTDIWSLGVILFELLTGSTPFNAESFEGLLAQVLTSPPRELRELCPEASVELERVVARCLEKDREGRFRNVADLASATTRAVALDVEELALVRRIERHHQISFGSESASIDEAPTAHQGPPLGSRAELPSPSESPPTPSEAREPVTDLAAASTHVPLKSWRSPSTGGWLLGGVAASLVVAGAATVIGLWPDRTSAPIQVDSRVTGARNVNPPAERPATTATQLEAPTPDTDAPLVVAASDAGLEQAPADAASADAAAAKKLLRSSGATRIGSPRVASPPPAPAKGPEGPGPHAGAAERLPTSTAKKVPNRNPLDVELK